MIIIPDVENGLARRSAEERAQLIRVLLEDARSGQAGGSPSQHDFGKNIIPSMVTRDEKVYAYPFTGLWWLLRISVLKRASFFFDISFLAD